MSQLAIDACARDTMGNESGDAAATAANVLSLAAAPTFAVMALLTGALGIAGPEMLCAAAPRASPLNGMVVMYLLMGVFHLAPWLKLASGRRHAVCSARP